MANLPIVISFYTLDSFYQIHAQNLMASCENFFLETSIEAITSFGTWELNCAYKPLFILKKLEELQKPVLWVDADAHFVNKPDTKIFDCDFAVRINENLPEDHPSKVMSGTIFINHTSFGLKIVKMWAQECLKQLSKKDRTEEFWDQTALRDVLMANRSFGKVNALPVSYTKISGHPLDMMVKETVIEHHQASRAFK